MSEYDYCGSLKTKITIHPNPSPFTEIPLVVQLYLFVPFCLLCGTSSTTTLDIKILNFIPIIIFEQLITDLVNYDVLQHKGFLIFINFLLIKSTKR